ncbi:hypothetical protein NC661_01790 [Aquibacillus koreensis]|uniref:RNA polymerase subunit sigma-70 n=1 Tax=Aquibacillus koreensis TaxID=279446 RepID=A0A9X4AGX3_9BACI|nr:hypothetical protein [Aquibacillus koreensis]MCT2537663.1 hypothetical protein [Aquibacillus koreensis]MDC3419109.1 hypothetical protein [Aquibacillus koreensis]
MRLHPKQAGNNAIDHLYGANFHRFVEMESSVDSMEIAQELGLSLGDVKKLKEKLKRS